LDSTLSFSIQLARESGEILLDYFRRPYIKTDYKPDHSIVTEADVAVDRHISQAIRTAFPEDILLSEELQPDFSPSGNNVSFWIVDPLDGTTNFSLGLHYWGISLVRVENGFPNLAVQYFPYLNEIYTAQKGCGIYLNETQIHVCSPNPANRTTFFSCCSRTIKNYQVSIPYKIRIFGSATYSLCSLARGNALISFEAKAKIWDFAGAWLMIPEAGGCIELFDRRDPFPLSPGNQYAGQNYAILGTATPELMEKARQKIIPK
jgi:myo-inositol-1(or 4)-monophosphatase